MVLQIAWSILDEKSFMRFFYYKIENPRWNTILIRYNVYIGVSKEKTEGKKTNFLNKKVFPTLFRSVSKNFNFTCIWSNENIESFDTYEFTSPSLLFQITSLKVISILPTPILFKKRDTSKSSFMN